MTIESVLDADAKISESATSVADEAALHWFDVKAPALYRKPPDLAGTRTWTATCDVGGFALAGDGGAIGRVARAITRPGIVR